MEELRCELLDIAAAVQAVVPGGRHIREEAVCMIESAALQVAVHGSERLHPDQVEEHSSCRHSRAPHYKHAAWSNYQLALHWCQLLHLIMQKSTVPAATAIQIMTMLYGQLSAHTSLLCICVGCST